MAEVEFHPLAIAEARAAHRRYARVSQALADRFVASLDAAVAAVEANSVGQAPYLRGTRVLRLKPFPTSSSFSNWRPTGF